MTTARRNIIDLNSTPYYHCVNRCVRRAFLCGVDKITGTNYENRKQLIVDRMKQLTEIFGIELCAYAVMSNHYHVVLHVHSTKVVSWSEKDVASRWVQLYKNPVGIKYLQDENLTLAELEALNTYLPVWRERLKDISWYMRSLNEYIARMANKEDDCKGHFWQGRYKSQALTDEAALLACMVYVDLNPVRAKIANTPEDSDHTSVQEHIIAHKNAHKIKLNRPLKKVLKDNPHRYNNPKNLKRFYQPKKNNDNALPIERSAYLELVDWTGRVIKTNKRGAIPENLVPILTRLNINPTHWYSTVSTFKHAFGHVVGTIVNLDDWRQQKNKTEGTTTHWFKGNKSARRFYHL
jgi:REP element-mobilizing transposase RayT